jgi:hypothetical protein
MEMRRSTILLKEEARILEEWVVTGLDICANSVFQMARPSYWVR